MVFIPVRITHVLPDDPLIKVYGVGDDCQIEFIDRILESYHEKLENGYGSIHSPKDAARGTIVLVPLFRKYKRAEIFSSEEGGGRKVAVRFLDVGGIGYFELNELRLIDAVPELRFIVLPQSPPSEYILDAVLKIKEWPSEELQTMNNISRFTKDKIKCAVHSVVNGYPLINVHFSNGENFSSFASFLIGRGFVSPATLEQMKVAISIKDDPSAVHSQPFQISPPIPPGLSQYEVQPSSSDITFYSLTQGTLNQLKDAINMKDDPPAVHSQPFQISPPTHPGLSQYKIQPSSSDIFSYSETQETLNHMKIALNMKDDPSAVHSQPFQISPPTPSDLSQYKVQPSSSGVTSYSQIQLSSSPSSNNLSSIAAPLSSCAEVRSPNEVHQQLPKTEPVPRNLSSHTFPIGSQYEVYVSNIINGMQNFIIQIKSQVDTILSPFMIAINEAPVERFDNLLQPGVFCLGRYAGDNSLCRAVVSTVLADGANLYFVDFGNFEVVPFSEIFKIPPQFMGEKMFATRFSLTGCSDNYLLSSKEANELFANLIINSSNSYFLRVMQPEAPPKQYCELFLRKDGKMVNIKDEILDKMKTPQTLKYKRIPLKKNSQADVVVSFVASAVRIFVQLSLNDAQLNNIMNSVGKYCATNAPPVTKISKNMPVCALYPGDHKWYRAIVTSDTNPAGNVEVLFVDYGNTEFVHISNLRTTSDKIISLGPIQAVECQLDLDAELSLREDVTNQFSDMVAENEYVMHVSSVLSDEVICIDLFEKTTQKNIKDTLFQRFQLTTQLSSRSNDGPRDDNFITPNESLQTLNHRNKESNSAGTNKESFTLKTYRTEADNNITIANEINKIDLSEEENRFVRHNPISEKYDEKNIESSFNWSKEPPNENAWNNYDVSNWSQQVDLMKQEGNFQIRENKDDQSIIEPLQKLGNLTMTELLEQNIRAERENDSRNECNDLSNPTNWKNKNDLNDRKNVPSSDKWQESKAPNLKPADDRGAKFVQPDYQLGQQIEVKIISFVNPALFIVMPAENNDLRAMMESFQASYSRRQPANLSSLTFNDCIVARGKDDWIYRARFLHGRPGGAMVTFVDYGNNETVRKGQVWAVSQEHCELPMQAMCCELHDVETIDENTPWSQLEGVDKFFEGDKFTLTFKECNDLKGTITWSVDLMNAENADIGSLLVKNGLAVRRKIPKNE